MRAASGHATDKFTFTPQTRGLRGVDDSPHLDTTMTSQMRDALQRTLPLFSAAIGFQFGLMQQQKDPSILPFTAVKLEEKGIRAGADVGMPVCGTSRPPPCVQSEWF